MEELHRRAESKRIWKKIARADKFGEVLFNSVLQPLGGTTYVATSTVA